VTTIALDTPQGGARVHLHPAADDPGAALVLGHGAGGGVAARDLVAVTKAARDVGVSVALVEQPYRVLGRRSAPRAPVLDAAWISIVSQLAGGAFAGLPIITGGRSSGARVACRTAAATGAVGVLCLAFPLVAPSGVSRQEELDDAGVSVLVIQGESDRFGIPAPDPERSRSVVVVRGDHGLKADPIAVADAAATWLLVQLARVG
jgi:predicted alpha/beta-hydrolase family hydrolase